MTQKTMLSNTPGFLCPACGRVRLKVSLAEFLSSQEIRCPSCHTPFLMDKSSCSRMIEMLQELDVAQRNIQLIQGKR